MDLLTKVTVTGLQHIGIPVTDIKKSEAFYTAFGFRNVMQSSFPFQGDSGICIMMERDHMILELYQMPPEVLKDIRNRKDGHIDHLAFNVTDVDHAYTSLKNMGYNIVEPGPVFLQF